MFTVTKWWLVRHAPVPGFAGRLYPHEDVEADVSDAAAFQSLAERLPEAALWVTSGVRRAEQTAAAIRAAGLQPDAVEVEPALAEQTFGSWAGKSYSELMDADDSMGQSFWQAPGEVRPPEGESFADLIGRVAPALRRLTETHSGREIVAVVHGGSIRAALAHALGLEPNKGFAVSIDNLSTTRIDHIRRDGGGDVWRVAFVNLRPR